MSRGQTKEGEQESSLLREFLLELLSEFATLHESMSLQTTVETIVLVLAVLAATAR